MKFKFGDVVKTVGCVERWNNLTGVVLSVCEDDDVCFVVWLQNHPDGENPGEFWEESLELVENAKV